MGCGSSKLKESKCKSPLWSAVSRRCSKLVHHPPSKEGDSYHVVALTSSTLGSLRLERSISPPTKPMPYYSSFNGRLHTEEEEEEEDRKRKIKKADLELDMMEAKAWSKMIQDRMEKRRPMPREPETINAWEMMEGLEEDEEEEDTHHKPPVVVAAVSKGIENENENENEDEDAKASSKPHSNCLSNAGKDYVASEFNTEVISAFRKALDELSPTNPFHLSKYPHNVNVEEDTDTDTEEALVVGGVEDMKKKKKKKKKNVNATALELHLPYGDGTKLNVSIEKEERGSSLQDDPNPNPNKLGRHEEEVKLEKVVLYLTTLRGIRKTYEDCCDVKLILKGLGVRVDERDVSMHSAFKEELRELLLLAAAPAPGGLPRVFLGHTYIGGADDIRRMDEDGSLFKLLRRCEFTDHHSINGASACQACADVRFVPCHTCSGSCKFYYQPSDDDHLQIHPNSDHDNDHDDFGFQRCPDCNENGLIRCPVCCS